jgi:hypothetical protein
VFNTEITEDEFLNIKVPHIDLIFDKNGSYEATWKNAWNLLSQEEKQQFLDLPHFNADIFKKITGIEVNNQKNELLKKAQELIDKANELKLEAEKIK